MPTRKLLSRLVTPLVCSMVLVAATSRDAHAQADLIIATNAEITFPACTESLTHFYFFTVVDDGGGISQPTISNLNYAAGPINKIDSYDSGEFTYATFEVAVTVPSPALGATVNDCFTITYEGETVNPCFDVVKPSKEVCEVENDFVQACVHKETGMVRLVADSSQCRPQELPLELAVPNRSARAAAAAVPSQPSAPRRP